MVLHVTTTHRPATDLGYLLGKNPARTQSFSLPYGQAHVCYPEAADERCTASLILDIDPVGLVRGSGGSDGREGLLAQYVNDRPYVASSFMSVALARVFASALNGACRDRPELAERAIPLEAALPVLPCRGGEALIRRLFEPLGYTVTAARLPLDERFPDWGESPYYRVSLAAECRLQALLTHLYVLLPVLDNEKHYWIGPAELEKLLERGEGWLAGHPERDLITHRYLRRKPDLVREALARLRADETPDPDAADTEPVREEEQIERPMSLNRLRQEAVLAALRDAGAARVIDLGCGEGRLLDRLLRESSIAAITGMDVSTRMLQMAAARLDLDRMAPRKRERIQLFQGSLTYRDERLAGYDAACAVEVIEHLDPPRLAAFERVLFEFARPQTVLLTTPNVEFNSRFPTLPAGKLRHRDHRFEWTRAEFQTWMQRVAAAHGYTAEWRPIGESDADAGPATQMGVFTRCR